MYHNVLWTLLHFNDLQSWFPFPQPLGALTVQRSNHIHQSPPQGINRRSIASRQCWRRFIRSGHGGLCWWNHVAQKMSKHLYIHGFLLFFQVIPSLFHFLGMTRWILFCIWIIYVYTTWFIVDNIVHIDTPCIIIIYPTYIYFIFDTIHVHLTVAEIPAATLLAGFHSDRCQQDWPWGMWWLRLQVLIQLST